MFRQELADGHVPAESHRGNLEGVANGSSPKRGAHPSHCKHSLHRFFNLCGDSHGHNASPSSLTPDPRTQNHVLTLFKGRSPTDHPELSLARVKHQKCLCVVLQASLRFTGLLYADKSEVNVRSRRVQPSPPLKISGTMSREGVACGP